ncbi:MAG: tlde1 domain-containing protein [Pseudolabrys sp.]
MVASRVSSVSSRAAHARRRSARRHTVSIVLSGFVLSGLAFGSAGVALFGTGNGLGAPAPDGTPHKGLQVALAAQAPMAQHQHRAPLNRKDDERPVAVLTPPAQKPARVASAEPARNVTVLAKTAKPAPRPQAVASAGDRPKDDLKAPYQLASADTGLAPAPTPLARAVKTLAITRDSAAETDITGSLGKAAEAKAPGKVALAAPAKSDSKADTKAEAKSHAIPSDAIRAETPKTVLAKPVPPKPARPLTPHEKLYGPVRLASLGSVTPDTLPNTVRDANGGLPVAPYDRNTAVYVITSKRVYLPDGTSLEAHSGLGQYMDNPKFAHLRMRGVTPPHVYTMKMREALFHGVEAIRLNPIGGERAIFGRDGLLAHTYMLGPNGQSNGCVSFKDYRAFLNAFKSGRINRLAVISHLD